MACIYASLLRQNYNMDKSYILLDSCNRNFIEVKIQNKRNKLRTQPLSLVAPLSAQAQLKFLEGKSRGKMSLWKSPKLISIADIRCSSQLELPVDLTKVPCYKITVYLYRFTKRGSGPATVTNGFCERMQKAAGGGGAAWLGRIRLCMAQRGLRGLEPRTPPPPWTDIQV